MNSREKRRLYDDMMRRLTAALRLSGVKPTTLARASGLHHDAIGRKIAGRDDSIMKESTLKIVEETAAQIAGSSLLSRQALEAELRDLDREIAGSIDDLTQALVDAGVLSEEQLPERLRELLRRRRFILELITTS